MSYDLYFGGKKSVWLPLYLKLKSEFEKEKLPFEEYFPKMGIVWRNSSAFAIIYPKVKCLEVSFCCDGIDPDIPTEKYMTVSKHRVTHYLDIVDESKFEELVAWIKRSYTLTQKT